MPDTAPTPEERVLGATTEPGLASALGDLTPELLDVVVATTVDGLTNKEAAVMLGIPVGTLKTRARKARRLLQESLQGQEAP